jgi:hypothetical protein
VAWVYDHCKPSHLEPKIPLKCFVSGNFHQRSLGPPIWILRYVQGTMGLTPDMDAGADHCTWLIAHRSVLSLRDAHLLNGAVPYRELADGAYVRHRTLSPVWLSAGQNAVPSQLAATFDNACMRMTASAWNTCH